MNNEHLITRRDFLRKTATISAVLSIGMPLNNIIQEKKLSKVVLIRNAEVLDRKGNINSKILELMFDEGVQAYFNTKTALEAWRNIITPSDIVGIKSNVWSYLPTPSEVEKLLKSRILDIGVPEKNIGIDDRGVLNNRVFQNATALINVRPLRTHNWSGIGGCIKNYIMFTPRPSAYHNDSCADLGALWNLPIVKNKTRINFLLMLTPQFHHLGAHHFDKEFTWHYNGILVGTDPVALDAVGLKILELKRKSYFKEETPLRPPAKHVFLAEKKHNIGVSDFNQIEIIKLGWKEGTLI